jgi:hypothetical protein
MELRCDPSLPAGSFVPSRCQEKSPAVAAGLPLGETVRARCDLPSTSSSCPRAGRLGWRSGSPGAECPQDRVA